MSKASMHSFELGRARSSAPMIDKCAIVPILACALPFNSGAIIDLLLLLRQRLFQVIGEPARRIDFSGLRMAAISVVLAMRNRSRLVILPPHIICLLAYLAFAGASVLWAFRPELSFIRFVLQVMIVTSIVLPAMLAVRTADMMRGLFLCFAFASILNVFFVLGQNPVIAGYDKGLI